MARPRDIASEIKRMHQEGANYTQIMAELGCAKSTISYHVGKGNEYARVRENDTRNSVKRFIRNYKNSHPCADCDIIWPYYTMQFDHLPQFKKSFAISKFYDYTNDLIVVIAEMKKCDLVCGNCHSIRTHNRRIKTLKIKTIKDELTKEYDVSEEEG